MFLSLRFPGTLIVESQNCLSSGDPFTMIPAMGSNVLRLNCYEGEREGHCNIAELETFSCFMCEHCEQCRPVSPSALKVETLQCSGDLGQTEHETIVYV